MIPRQTDLLHLLQRHPEGMALADIATTMGSTRHRCSYDLRVLKSKSLVAPNALGGPFTVWATTTHIAALVARRMAAIEAAQLDKTTRATRRAAATSNRRFEDAEVCAFARAPIQRRVQQGEWHSQAPAGPHSVFHLGIAV